MILFDKMMACVLGDTFYTDVLLIGLAEEAKGLIVVGAELIILPYLFFLLGELEGDVVFG